MAAIEDATLPGTPREALPEPAAPLDLRSSTARGTLVNAAFTVGVSAITLLQGVIVARLLAPEVYGRWGLLMAGLMAVLLLGTVGVDDKYVQQDDADQQRAFEIAFTLQLLLGALLAVALLVGMPLFAILYEQPEIGPAGAAFAIAMPALALQMPLWVHYRRLDFVRQRTLQTVDPVVTFVATIGLAAAGLGLWALVIGAITGTWAASLVIARTSPYPLRLRFERSALREYRRFSMPLFVGALTTVLLVQGPVIVASRVLGVTAVAGIALATSLAQFTTRVDDLVTQAMYPAICRVKDRPDLLAEAYWKSNRLALLWAAPLGLAVALFAGDFVHLVVGEEWRFAAPLIATYGVSAVLNQIGFNWSAFYRAIGETRPLAVASVIGLVAMMTIGVPLLAFAGLTAFGLGLMGTAVIGVAIRLRYLRRIFPALAYTPQVVRGIGPALPGVVVVLALRAVDLGERTAGLVAFEATVYVVLAVAVTCASERSLLREMRGYMRQVRSAPAPA